MSTEPSWVREALSSPRFAPYLAKAGGDLAAAIELYWWNVDVSAAFYFPLHCLEVALRNALHRQLSESFGRDDWWSVAPLRKKGPQLVAVARRKLTERGRPGTADNVVAELSLGFWVSLVSRNYTRDLWVPYLHKVFPRYPGGRGALHHDLTTVLLFRNRIMHHEPIHHRHLEADHRTIRRVLDYLSPAMITQLEPYDRVERTLKQRPAPPESGR
ncbi:hypothetical protein [Amycolatopsis sp. CA-128772]|uniref:hypothetical protein n=1 Tax=Amycolatopsis sp. CA-128772 TaxID=2073159 RepID=UPI000CD15733|nr:hypothetical protein [Amycolatopsis sp. CA-128772]